MSLHVDPHPLLDLAALRIALPAPLGELASSPSLLALLVPDARAPLARDEEARAAVRRLLRHGGFKPSGRSKPASEYLVRAAEAGALGSINPVVDLGNAVSLHSGLPISVVDAGRARAPLRVRVAAPDAEFVFNAAGQTIRLGGLLGLEDADGPCANAVKDAQRTKTDGSTREVLVLIWGTREAPGRAAEAAAWMVELADGMGLSALLEPWSAPT